jgi:glutathione S-transferase
MHSALTPTLTAFANAPDRGRGMARDMSVRWAFEEVGQAYDARLVTLTGTKAPAHRRIHPFGQIPVFQVGQLVLFESGAIVLYIAQTHSGLLPDDEVARARAIMWMFAALSTIEPVILYREVAGYRESGESWHSEREPFLEAGIRDRFGELAQVLGDAEWLEGDFTAGDLLMIQVLRRLSGSHLLTEHPRLDAYVRRGEARPAFQRAFAAQREDYERSKGQADA